MIDSRADPAAHAMAVAAHHLAQSRPERALDAISRADPSAPGYWEIRASALHDLERYPEAIAAAAEGLKRSRSAPLLLVLASARAELNEFAEAERVILSSLEDDPSNTAALTTYARTLAIAGQFEKALAVAAEAARHAPTDVSVLCTQAFMLWMNLHDAEAERLARHVLSDSPEHTAALCLLATIESERGQHHRSYGRLRQVLGRNPALIGTLRRGIPEAEAAAHPLLAAARPLMTTTGPAMLWLAVVAALIAAVILQSVWIAVVVATAYVAYAVYGHVVFWWFRRSARRRLS